MIYDHDVAAIVVLNCPPMKMLAPKNFIDFWPQAAAMASGKFSPEDLLKQESILRNSTTAETFRINFQPQISTQEYKRFNLPTCDQ
jgi:hypothetical protein